MKKTTKKKEVASSSVGAELQWQTLVVRIAMPKHWRPSQCAKRVETELVQVVPERKGVLVMALEHADQIEIVPNAEGTRVRLATTAPTPVRVLRTASERRAQHDTRLVSRVVDRLIAVLDKAERDLWRTRT